MDAVNRERLSQLLSEAFIKVRDNFGMPNSAEVADYLIAHGVTFYKRDPDKLYQVVSTHVCDESDGDCGRCGDDMRYLSATPCIHHKIIIAVKTVSFTSLEEPYTLSSDLFETREDIETEIRRIQKLFPKSKCSVVWEE